MASPSFHLSPFFMLGRSETDIKIFDCDQNTKNEIPDRSILTKEKYSNCNAM